MPIARALVVGVPQPSASSGWSADYLPGVLNDVSSMAALFSQLSFQPQVVKSDAAKAGVVLADIRSAAQQLAAGDLFVFYYAGHGAQKQSADGDELQDQLLLTYDRPIVDDELGACWPLFRKHVRIVVITDSCHSGSVVREIETPRGIVRTIATDPADTFRPRTLSIGLAKAKSGSETTTRDGNIEGLQGSLLHIAACLDSQQATDLGNHGAFTDAFLTAWNAGFRASYDQLFAETRQRMQLTTQQTARMTLYGWYQGFFRGQRPLDPAQHWPPI